MINEINLGDLYSQKTKSLNPKKFLNETFELFSIRAYDNAVPEMIKGKDIGSSKKILQSNDVILSRIVPHIKRCWIVPQDSEHRKIGSGEWIVFRNRDAYPDYLRYYLLSNPFHSMFMSTVKGVGGSLLRADPKQVARFKIPLPPLDTQKRIAQILDDAAALRDTTAQLLKEYDLLAQSIFLEMFGDPVVNPKGWKIEKLNDVSTKITDGEHGTVQRLESGKMYLMARNIGHNGLILDNLSFISEINHNKIFKRCNPEKGDLLLVCVGATIGRCCIMPDIESFSLARSVALIKPNEQINSHFLYHQFKQEHFQHQIERRRNTSAQAGLYTGQIKKLNVIVPPVEYQNQFAEKIALIEQQKALAKQELQESEDLFNCLLQKAFKGELV